MLTDQERKLLLLIAQGLTSKSIGKIMFVSRRTVENNIQNIFSKLNVHTRTYAVIKALKIGEIELGAIAEEKPCSMN